MSRRPRWSSLTAVVLVLLASFAMASERSAAAPGAGACQAESRLQLKDGRDDDSEESDNSGSGSSSDDSNSGPGSSSDDAEERDDSGSSSGNSGSGSDDSVSGSDVPSGEIDDEVGDDHGSERDDFGGESSGEDANHGNDDFEFESQVESPDGDSVPVVDDDQDQSTDGFRSGQAIVRLQPDASIDEFNQRNGTTLVAAVIDRDLYLLQLPTSVSVDESMTALSSDLETRWVELNYVNQAPEGRPGYFFVSGDPMDEPGDEYASTLLGYGAGAKSCATGSGVVVAVLDTGIDANHPALDGRVIDGGWNALNDSADVDDVGNDKDDDGDGLVDEMVGHGTHVAGIVAQVAPDASILPVKVLGSDGVGDAFFVAAGIYYAADRGADVINLSLSTTYDARVVAEAVAEANEAGVVVVAAAGNRDSNRVLEFPAADTGVVGVAATDQADKKSEFSNYGERIDISAPGVGIVSALPGGKYAAWSGTSMATPFVSGAAALLFEAHARWSAPEVASRLTKTARGLDEINPDFAGELGAGRVDVGAALDCAKESA